MKLFLIENSGVGLFRSRLAKKALMFATEVLHWQGVDKVEDAELIIVIGSEVPEDPRLIGRKLALTSIDALFADSVDELKALAKKAKVWQRNLPENKKKSNRSKKNCGSDCLPDRCRSYFYGC